MKKFLWIYRMLLGICLLAIPILLVLKGWAVLGKPALLWFIDLSPYSSYSLLAGIFILAVWTVLSETINKRKLEKALAEMLENEEAGGTFEQLAEQCGVTLTEGDAEFCLPFQDHEHALWCAIYEDEFTVGLMGSPHHEHYSNMKAALEEIRDICAEKKVQMIFFDANGEEHWNDLYSTEELDAKIFARFHPLRAPQTWWEKCLRISFLFFPPFTPKVLRAQIYSYRGTYDREVFREE